VYLRFVHLHVREGKEAEFARFYQERVIPALASTPGCLYAGLLAPWRGTAHQSLTIWDAEGNAAAYEESSLYDRLLAESTPMLASRAEWRVRLARDAEETIDPSRRQPPSEGYHVENPEGTAALYEGLRPPFVRIVLVRVGLDRLADFVNIYRHEVIPALQAVPGCRGAFLAEGANRRMEVLSITVWDREEGSVRYEMSGEFERLTFRLAGTFAPVFGWETRLEGAGATAKPQVSSYELVRGRRLAPRDDGNQ
jgi:heme-degrading monooxygenase HmoA